MTRIPPSISSPGVHLPLLDDVLVVDDQQVAALLVVAERDVRHQQRLDVLLLGDAHAHEQARLQHAVLVLEHGAAGQRAGAGIDLRRHVVERAGVRIALLGLQADIDGDRSEVLQRDAGNAHALADRQHLLLVDVELHVDRHRAARWWRAWSARRRRPWRRDRRGAPRRCRRTAQRWSCRRGCASPAPPGPWPAASAASVEVALGARFIDLGDRHRGGLHEILLALQVGVGLDEQRLLLGLRRLGDLQVRSRSPACRSGTEGRPS